MSIFHNDEHIFLAILNELQSINVLLHRQFKAKSARLKFVNSQGDLLMPATIHVTGNGAQATFTEFTGPNGTGNQVAPVGPVVYSSDNTSVATVDSNGLCNAVGIGTCNITGTDQGNSLTASDTLTVVADQAQSATLELKAL